MTAHLKRIADHHLLRGFFCRDVGLWEGKMGISLFFYLLSRNTNNQWYEKYASELLDDVCNELSQHCPISFSDGLCGIGWAIEFLKHEEFIGGNTDEILEELDKFVMERDVRKITDTSLETGLEGIAAYVHCRINTKRHFIAYQPFEASYLEELDFACKKNSIRWMTDEYNVLSIWNKIQSLLPTHSCLDWQRGLKFINNKHE